MSLRQKQSRFAVYAAHLILHAYALGYEVTIGDVFRDPRAKYGSKKSNHHKKLAIDLNLFKDGRYQSSTKAHAKLGAYWEQMGKDAGVPLRWGGRVNDGNHYEWVP